MEKVLFKEGIFEFVSEEKSYSINNENKVMKRTFIRRPPGIRAIIVNDKEEILLSKEYRYELELFDYRLPGGKVFDNLDDYKKSMEEDNLLEHVYKTVAKEVKEEVGILIKNPTLYTVSHAGASVVWDLYYFIIDDYEIIANGQELEENEIIDGFVWKTKDEVIQMCLDKEIHEERTIGILLSYILKNEKSYLKKTFTNSNL